MTRPGHDKQRLRQDALAERARHATRALSPTESTALAHTFSRWLMHHPHIAHIAGYAAVRDELDCAPALDRARRSGRRIYYPRVRRASQLALIPVDDPFTQLHASRWGLREPRGQGCALEQLDLILVPGLLFDLHGGRLGFGGGYYDRLVARLLCMSPRACLLGVCHEPMLWRGRLPVQAHDRRVDGVITPGRVISFV